MLYRTRGKLTAQTKRGSSNYFCFIRRRVYLETIIPMSDLEPDYGSDQEISENHGKLIDAVSKLDKGQRVKKPQRSEPSLEVSEFHLVKSGISDKDAVRIDDLAKSLGGKGHHAEIKKKFKAARQKGRVLSKPLEKPAADKLKRVVGFENTKKELQAWNAIVARNRTAECLRFPLNQPSMKLQPTEQFVKRFRLQSDLEKELAALEPPKPVEEEKPDEFPLTLEEILQKRKEAARLRAQQSYKEAKAYRQNKIKSKKFHRIQRKERIKQQIKEFEELQKTDPQAALEKLEQLDKTRAEERMSLRHKSTGQWAKSKQVRAKYDKESRQVLAQQLSISKTLTQKIRSNDDSDDDDETANELPKASATDRDNPWVNGAKTPTEIDDFISGYRKYWEKKNAESGRNNVSSKVDDDAKRENEKKKPKTSPLRKNRSATNPVESVIEYENPNDDSPLVRPIESVKTVKNPKTPIFAVQNYNEENYPKSNVAEKNTKKTNGKSVKSKPTTDVRENSEPSATTEVPRKIGKNLKTGKSKISGTSGWHVEPVNDVSVTENSRSRKILGIDELFETMEDKLISRIDTKLKSVKRKLATNAAAYEKLKATENEKPGNEEYSEDLSFKKRKIRPDLDEEMDEETGISGNRAMKKKSLREELELANGLNVVESTSEKTRAEIDPNKFINVKPKHVKTQLPDTVTGGDEALDDSEGDEEQHNIISEAFADDDVVDEFRKEKADEVKKSEPENLDLRLPGWGSWGGKDIVKSTRKKRRFIMKFPKEKPRRDENKGDVVIIEENDPKIRAHQVSDLPYPFTSVKDFEASIRAPIGRNFVPENAHKRFIEPTVKTRMGEIIEPMDVDALLSKKPKPRKRTKHPKKTKNIQKKNNVPKKNNIRKKNMQKKIKT